MDWKLEDDDAAKYGLTQDDKKYLKSLIWVGASTIEDKKWPDSNYGPRIDLFAPGDVIKKAASTKGASTPVYGGTAFVRKAN